MKIGNICARLLCYKQTLYNRHVWGLVARRHASKSSNSDAKTFKGDLSSFPVERIRNFSIIAHVDHGKSTLADRLLEITGVISTEQKNEQVLDKLQVERERGITVKAQTASLIWQHTDGEKYLLNLIDTPGHVDFNYEVSRSLAACQGVLLLVDANQGVQAQTVANFYLAFESELSIIPVMNKIDLKVARPDEVQEEITSMFDFKPEDVLRISAKKGTGVESVLTAVIEKIPPPPSDIKAPFKALLFDSTYDKFKGAVANLAVLDGSIKKGDRVTSAYHKKTYEVMELGIMHPHEMKTSVLYAGQVGYMYCGMKNIEEAQVGDTFYAKDKPVEALPGFRPAKPMVFAGIYPMDQSEFNNLRSAMEKLTLNDSSVQVNVDSSAALGQGWRLGFLGLLHMDVFQQRLDQEHNASVIITTPNVPYKVRIFGKQNIKLHGSEELTVLNPCHMPDPLIVKEYMEPMVLATILAPDTYLGSLLALIIERRGVQKEQTYVDSKRIMFKVLFPLSEVIVDFFDELKSISSGYASFDYEDAGYETSNLVKIEIYLNGKIVEEFTQMAHVSKARTQAKRIVKRLQEEIPAQLFMIAVQAKIGSKVLAREDIKALRKDVLAKCYGGDVTRKMKLLRQQAEGKKKMRMVGNVNIPKEAFVAVLKK